MAVEPGRGDIRNLPPEIIGYAIQNPDWGQRGAHVIAQGNAEELSELLREANLPYDESIVETLLSLDHERVHGGLEDLKGQEFVAA